MWPLIIGGAVLAGAAVFLFEEKKAKAKTSTVPRSPVRPSPTTPIFKPEPSPPAFKPEPKPAPVPVAAPAVPTPLVVHPELDVTNPASGAIQVAPNVFQKPDGGLVQTLPTVEVVGTPTPNEAQVKAGATDPGFGKRSTKAYYKWAQVSLNQVFPKTPKLDEDGSWGPKSKERTKAFQSANGLQADGIVGLNTENKLMLLGAGIPPYQT